MSSNSFGKVTRFVGSRDVPGFFEFGVLSELVVFESLSSFCINDVLCKVALPGKQMGCNLSLVGAGGAHHCWVTRAANALIGL